MSVFTRLHLMRVSMFITRLAQALN